MWFDPGKIENLKSGTITYKMWKGGTRIQHIWTTSRSATYSYFDDTSEQYVFMDNELFEEIRIGGEMLGEMSAWLAVGIEVEIQLFEGLVIEFGFKSAIVEEVVSLTMEATAAHGGGHKTTHKFVCLSNGVSTTGPPYLQVGDKVVLDPKTGDILRRV